MQWIESTLISNESSSVGVETIIIVDEDFYGRICQYQKKLLK